MESLMEALVALVKNLISLAGQGVGLLGSIIALPGIIGLAIGGFIYWLAWKQTKSVLGSLLWLLFSFVIIFVISSWVFWPFLFKGSENSLTNCYETAGTNSKQIAVCNAINNGFVVSASAQTQSQQTPIIVVEPVPENPKQFVRKFRENALELLTQGWNLTPPNWPSDMQSQLVGPEDIPAGLTISFSCQNQISVLKNEIWDINISGIVPGIGQKSLNLKANGYFARDKKGFDAKNNTTIVGTGTWENACSQCYVDEEILQPTPVPTLTPAPPAVTKVQFPQPVCGYWGYFFSGGAWLVVPTTGGQADFSHATSVAKATGDINNRCPGESLPATP